MFYADGGNLVWSEMQGSAKPLLSMLLSHHWSGCYLISGLLALAGSADQFW